jgi:penicillin-binding protein 1A
MAEKKSASRAAKPEAEAKPAGAKPPPAEDAAAPAPAAPTRAPARAAARGSFPARARAWLRALVPPRRAAGPRTRVHVGNRADGGIFYWLGKLYAFAAAVCAVGFLLSVVCTYRYFASAAPPAPDLRTYAAVAPAVSRIYAADGTLLGEFAREFREITPYDEIPEPLVHAFLAVEDHEFFLHGGIYFRGIARAAWANVTAGDFAQGGSTITQQVAKQFLGAEKSLDRKAKEAIMARRLEARYSKKAILSVYLNHIFLGAGAYGVAAAAHRYFQKDLHELTLAEMALIAGLAQAPSRYSPIRNPEAALARRDTVLDQMEKWGFASSADVAAAKAEPLRLNVYRDVFPERMPYYAEHVRRYVTEKYGEDALLARGLRVEAAVEPVFEAAAYGNIDYVTHKQDKRQGWRGPEWYLGDEQLRATFVERQRALYGAGPLEPGRRYLALVEDVASNKVQVRVGDRALSLPLSNMNWAAEWKPGEEAENDRTITNAKKALKPGDVIWVSREIRTKGKFRDWHLGETLNPTWRAPDDESKWDSEHEDVVQLEQVPHPQAVLFTGDHRTTYVQAMVGGHDYSRSVLNRAVQSCRQPASAFKPIYYSLALEEGFGYDTVLYDEKVSITDPVTGAVWEPKNIFEDLDGDVSLEYALVFSKNIPSVDLFKRLGADNVVKWAQERLGFTTKMYADDALALGSSCTYLDELTRAFAIFARNGKWLEWSYVRRIVDRDGNTVEDNTVPFDPMLRAGDRLDRVAAVAGVAPREAIKPRTAFLVTKLLAKMVEHGLTKTLRQTEIHAGGKTGTSSYTLDTQFLGFTSRFITLVWMGDDKNKRALGRHDAAYITIVPLWARYMYEVAKNFPNDEVPWAVPDGVEPNDRGDHAKGQRGARMTLVRHYAKDVMEAEGLLPPEGGPGEGGGDGAAPPAPGPGT